MFPNKIKKGDLISYQHHITIVNSIRPEKLIDNAGIDEYVYEIIHASGDNRICYKNDDVKLPDTCKFNRKVVINEINNRIRSNTLLNPIGFGRIKLWP